jgi:predicted DNA-binding WGR domain protein
VPLYEFEEGASRKFYRIDLDGRRVLLHWGRIGTEGEHQILSYETDAEARREYANQCEKRTENRGYRLVHDEGIPHDPEMVSRERLAKMAPLGASPRFLFTKKQRFAWVEARGASLLSVRGTRDEEERIAPVEKPCGSAEAAIRARDAMIAKLIGKGYALETFGATDNPAPKRKKPALADASQLERVIEEDPYDEGSWSVLEDWLLEHEHDPRGELVRLAKEKQLAEHAQSRGAAFPLLFGKKHEALSRAVSRTVWRGGYVVECEFFTQRSFPQLLAAFLASPAARLLRSLVLPIKNQHMAAAVCAVLAEARPRALRVLEVSGGHRVSSSLDCTMLSSLPLRRLSTSRGLHRPHGVAAISTLEELAFSASALEELPDILGEPVPGLHSLEIDLAFADRAAALDAEDGRLPRAQWLDALAAALGPIGAFAPKLKQLRLRFDWKDAAEVARDAAASLALQSLTVSPSGAS